jgi:hypothetical protein
VSLAGFNVAGNTGSALIVEGDGEEFFLWTADNLESLADRGWPVHAVVGRTKVYGYPAPDDSLAWEAQGLQVYVEAGPRRFAVRPSLEAVERLVEASYQAGSP